MSQTKASRLAEEIFKTLKYNPQLTDEQMMFSIEIKLDKFAREIEEACALSYRRSKENSIQVDARAEDIPELAKLMLGAQQQRGALN